MIIWSDKQDFYHNLDSFTQFFMFAESVCVKSIFNTDVFEIWLIYYYSQGQGHSYISVPYKEKKCTKEKLAVKWHICEQWPDLKW